MAEQSWTHAACADCWEFRQHRRVRRHREGAKEVCCFCGKETRSDLYVLLDPALVPCQGYHQSADRPRPGGG